MRKVLPIILFLLSLSVLVGTQVQAHRIKTVMTTVELNLRTGMLEVVHRIYAHDVEHTLGAALRDLGGLESIEGQARVALQLTRSFELWMEDGSSINLELVGAELEAEYFYVYQETPMSVMPETFRIRHEMLRDFWPDMTNYVNVRFSKSVDTVIFSERDGLKNISASR